MTIVRVASSAKIYFFFFFFERESAAKFDQPNNHLITIVKAYKLDNYHSVSTKYFHVV